MTTTSYVLGPKSKLHLCKRKWQPLISIPLNANNLKSGDSALIGAQECFVKGNRIEWDRRHRNGLGDEVKGYNDTKNASPN